MQVKKRNGKLEEVNLNKITERIKKLSYGLSVDPIIVATKTAQGLYDGVTTRELDNLAAETSAMMGTIHPDYDQLAARIEVSNLHKETSGKFVDNLYGLHVSEGIISKEFFEFCHKHKTLIESIIDYDRDYLFDYFGIKTLKRAYLLKLNGVIQERPQDMWMRVAAFININHPEDIKETYDLLSQKYYTHATPTLFNAGTIRPQLSSCFLLDIHADSIDGIYKTLSDCGKISQSAGGIGLAIHKIRSAGSPIKGTGGNSNGIVPMLRVFDATARYVDQCLHPKTIIYTNKGVRNIEDITIGDKVYTQEGVEGEVVEAKSFVAKNDSRLELDVANTISPIVVSERHPFYALNNQKIGLNFSIIKNRLTKNLLIPEYTEVNKLSTTSFIGYPIPKSLKDNDFTEDDCRIYGILLGDGYLYEDTAVIYLNDETNLETIKFVRQYLTNYTIPFVETLNGKVRRFRTSSSEFWKFRRSLCYKEDGSKYIHDKFLHLPESKSLNLIKGLIESDGHIGGKEILLEVTSHNLIESTRFILMRLGILSSGYKRNRIGEKSSTRDITAQKPTYTLRIPKDKKITNILGIKAGKFFKYFTYGDFMFSRVKGIKKSNYKGKLYDLRIKGNPSYLTEAGLAHNGGGKRKGSIAIYLEPWHADIIEFLDLKKNTGKEELRARDLFYALWAPDLFMERVKSDGDWTLFDPKVAKGLINDKEVYLYEIHSEEFNELYSKLELSGVGKRIKARDLWEKILTTQIETGVPYIHYKDSCNNKSNQQNLGTIKSSNLCGEVVQFTSQQEVSVCNLASISLPAFVNPMAHEDGIDYEKLYETSKIVCKNLNKVIDVNYYPVKEAETSNTLHRPIGIGVQGLADTFALLKIPFDSPEAKEINKRIFETIYHGSVDASIELAAKQGTYSSYKGSPASTGKLQFDLWGLDRRNLFRRWENTFENLSRFGLRNSLLLAPMPTASTSQILGNNECFEPFTSNIYTRRTLAGEFIVVNKHLIRDLVEMGLWNDTMRQQLMAANGSVQNLNLPSDLKNLYKTVWEISQKVIIDMAADRGPFVCQSQSMNIFMENPTVNKLTSMHFYGWEKGLKTGSYYIRSQAARDAIKFTITKQVLDERDTSVRNNLGLENSNGKEILCSLDDPENCESCGA